MTFFQDPDGLPLNYTNSIEDSFEAQRHFLLGMTKNAVILKKTQGGEIVIRFAQKEDRFAMAKLVLVILKDMELPFVAEIEKKNARDLG